MKIQSIIAALFLTSTFAFAQTGRVGINTEAPQTTLDISGKKDSSGNLLTTDMTGLQAPRLTRAELTAKGNSLYGTNQKGALIYITDVIGGDAGATTPRKNISSEGYYYFDGAFWVSIGSASTPATDVSIYNADGSLTGTGGASANIRNLNLNGSTLRFSGTQERTAWSASGIMNQVNTQASGGQSTFLMDGGGSALLKFQQSSAAEAQIFASNASTSLNLGTNTNTASAPIKFYTSAGSSAAGTEKAVITGEGKMGIGETVPTNKLHIKDTANPLRLEGLQTSTATSDQILHVTNTGVVTQKQVGRISGLLAGAKYVQGSSPIVVTQGNRADVPGVTITHVVPTGATQTLMITVVGYASKNPVAAGSGQGVFELYQDSTKISSGYVSVATGDGVLAETPLVSLPVPMTMLKRVTLTAGTYTFKVMFKSWVGSLTVNLNPTTYGGYDGDSEAMLTRMNIDVFNM